ncbi:hypothetical protein SCA6_016067 [Theobroma cacao]
MFPITCSNRLSAYTALLAVAPSIQRSHPYDLANKFIRMFYRLHFIQNNCLYTDHKTIFGRRGKKIEQSPNLWELLTNNGSGLSGAHIGPHFG